jgi:CheY-like chemotaxis protein
LENKPLRIIYVDDDADDRFLFESALNFTGQQHDLKCFNNGIEVIRELQKRDFKCDLMFLDLNMPVKSGIEVLEELQEIITKHRLRVIIFSTSGNEENIKATYDLNAVLYVEKPGDFNELIRVLQNIVLNHEKLTLPVPYKKFKYSRDYV